MVIAATVLRRSVGITWQDVHEGGRVLRRWLWFGVELLRVRLPYVPEYSGRRLVVAVSVTRLALFALAVSFSLGIGCSAVVRWAGRDLPTLGGVR